ncbi:MAG: ribokinase [Streptosporangiaceae bacterium]|jgi:ribokinase
MRDRKSGSRPRIAVVGSCNLDTVVYTGRLPAAGETVAGHRVLQVPGGKGANQAIAVARAGAAVTMIGAVGDDAAGADLRAALQEAGADTAGLRVSSAPTGSAHITVDSSGANAIVIVAGANAEVTALTHADQDVIARSDVLLLQLELPMPVVAAAAAAGRRAGTRVVLTPAPARPLPGGLLSDVDLLVANEPEASQLTGLTASPAVLAALLEQVPEVVITLGAAGCRYGRRSGARIAVPAPVVPVIDTTAAGDTFCGALAVALAEGRPAGQALRWATSAAALSVQRAGASPSMPGRAQIDAFAALQSAGEG